MCEHSHKVFSTFFDFDNDLGTKKRVSEKLKERTGALERLLCTVLQKHTNVVREFGRLNVSADALFTEIHPRRNCLLDLVARARAEGMRDRSKYEKDEFFDGVDWDNPDHYDRVRAWVSDIDLVLELSGQGRFPFDFPAETGNDPDGAVKDMDEIGGAFIKRWFAKDSERSKMRARVAHAGFGACIDRDDEKGEMVVFTVVLFAL